MMLILHVIADGLLMLLVWYYDARITMLRESNEELRSEVKRLAWRVNAGAGNST